MNLEQKHKLVDLGFIYCLKDPRNNEIFYIGATESAPKDRLAGHYTHFKEYLCGQRGENKRFLKFEEFFPELANIEVLEIIQNGYLYTKEIEYISKYRKTHNLTNQTEGGEGGDTFTLQTRVNKLKISELIAAKHTGKKKPDGFGENLSKNRMGKDNPAAGKEGLTPWCVVFDNDVPERLCKFPFEITQFLDDKLGIENHKLHSGRTGNISKMLRKTGITNSSNFKFIKFDMCSKEIQDIVHKNYENNFNIEISKENL